MSFNKYKGYSCCVGATNGIKGHIIQNGTTEAPVKFLRGTCVTCKRNKSLIACNQTTPAEGLGYFSCCKEC